MVHMGEVTVVAIEGRSRSKVPPDRWSPGAQNLE